MDELEPLQVVARLDLVPHLVHDLVDEFGAFSVVSFRPVVTRARRAKDKAGRPEQVPEFRGPNRVSSRRFEVDLDPSRDVLLGSGFYSCGRNEKQAHRQ